MPQNLPLPGRLVCLWVLLSSLILKTKSYSPKRKLFIVQVEMVLFLSCVGFYLQSFEIFWGKIHRAPREETSLSPCLLPQGRYLFRQWEETREWFLCFPGGSLWTRQWTHARSCNHGFSGKVLVAHCEGLDSDLQDPYKSSLIAVLGN